MAEIKFSWFAYNLESSIRIIRRGLVAAERALAEETNRNVEDGKELERKIEAGEEPGYELDEDGDLLYDPLEGIHYEHMAIDDTVQQVRKAMMISLYHAWERTARDLTGKTGPRDTHTVLETAMLEKSIAILPEIEQLRRLVNLLKHNSKTKMLQLFELRPHLFYNGFDPDVHFPNDWDQTVVISGDQVEAFFAAVIASGPKH